MEDGGDWQCGRVVNRGNSVGGIFWGIITKLVCRAVQLHLIGINLR